MASNIPIIVHGNSFSLAIPLQIYYINGDQMDLEDYTPDPTDEVSVQLKGSRRNYTYTPTIDGNVANIDLSGNELADNYSVVVSIVKANGQRLRSFRTDQFFIVESSDDLTMDDIIQGLEENVIYLNSQAFVAGEDGRGIESIVKTSTAGLVDTYTITYTDNTTSTFQVTNGANGQDGAEGVGITSIEKTGTSGLVDTYTITLSNGSTSTFEVTNGRDGHDLGLASIINNLKSDSTDDALSAAMGKELGERTRIRQTIAATSLCTVGGYYNFQTSALVSSSNHKYTLIPVEHILRLDVTGCYQKAVHYFASDKTTKVGRTTTEILTKDDFPSGAVYCGWAYNKNDYLNVVIDYDSAKEIADNMQGIVAEQIVNAPVYRGSIDSTTGEDNGELNSNWLFTKQFIPLCGATGIYTDENDITTGGFYWYDKDKRFISYQLSCKGMASPSNAVYCKVRLGAYTLGNTSATIHLYNTKISAVDIKDLQVGLNNISPRLLVGKSVAFLGDSITYASGGYAEYFGIISGATISKYAVSGKCYAGGEIAEQAANLVGNEDLVVMMGGTNDFNQAKAIGNIYDVDNGTITPTSDVTTFCGGLHKAINDIYTKCPTVQIVIITPPQKSNGWTANSASKYLYDYADAVKEVAKLYAIPVVDQFANCGINPVLAPMKAKYFNNDGTHPNSTYHKLLAEWLYTALATWVKEHHV